MATTSTKLEKGIVIAHQYRVQATLGAGGMGAVYRCVTLNEPAPRTVAVKVLHPTASETDLVRFARERDTMMRVKHLNVIQMLDFGTLSSAEPFLVLEYAEGGSLGSYLEARSLTGQPRYLTVPEAVWVIYQAAAGMRAARTVHRDLKPENLLLTRRNSTGAVELRVGHLDDATVVKVADWGLVMEQRPQIQAPVQAQRLTKTQDVFGTPLYMSPEQCRGVKNLTVQSDLYSLGVILYELVAGCLPFDTFDPYELMKAHCELPVPFPEDFPPELKDLVASLLEKSPEARPRSLLALQDQLRPLLGLPREWHYAVSDLDDSEPSVAPKGLAGLLRKLMGK